MNDGSSPQLSLLLKCLETQVAEVNFLRESYFCDEFSVTPQQSAAIVRANEIAEKTQEEDGDEEKVKAAAIGDVKDLPPPISFSLSLLETAPACCVVSSDDDDNDDSSKKPQFRKWDEGEALKENERLVIRDCPFKFVLDVTFPRRYPAFMRRQQRGNNINNMNNRLEWRVDPALVKKIEYNELLRVVPHAMSEHLENLGLLSTDEKGEDAKADDDDDGDSLSCVLEGTEMTMLVADTVKHKLLEMRHEYAEELLVAAQEQHQRDAIARDMMAHFAHQLDNSARFGRRAVYFHHIWCTGKRQCIAAWARTLRLGGVCKIGYPGILIVEGPEEGCVEYVRCLQRLRWKLMVVRGEEVWDVPPGDRVDDMRRFPGRAGVVETDDSSEIAEYCRAAGLESLFLTSMKIYSK